MSLLCTILHWHEVLATYQYGGWSALVAVAIGGTELQVKPTSVLVEAAPHLPISMF